MQDRSPNHTSKREAASDVLGRDVRDVIAEKRADGVAYDRIARDLFVETAGRVDVTGQALRNWSKSTAPKHRGHQVAPRPAPPAPAPVEDPVDAEIRGVNEWLAEQRAMATAR